MAEGKEEAQFGRGEAAIIRCTEEEDAEDMFLGLEADPHDHAKVLGEGELAELFELFLAFEGGPGRVALQVAEYDQAAEAGDEGHDVIVQPPILHGSAEAVAEAAGDDGSRASGFAVPEKEGTAGDADDAEDAVNGLREHFLNLTALVAGSGEVEVGERDHVAFGAALFFLVEGHEEQSSGDQLNDSDGEGVIGRRGNVRAAAKPQATKLTARRKSARDSWVRLSFQYIQAVANVRKAVPAYGDMPIQPAAKATDQTTRMPTAASARRTQT
jgi:hypothetical protein